MRWPIALVVAAGCSFIGVHEPPFDTWRGHPACNDNPVVPIADTVGAVAGIAFGGIVTGAIAYECATGNCDKGPLLLGSVPVLVLGVIYAASAYRGYAITSRCHAALQRPEPPEGRPAAPVDAQSEIMFREARSLARDGHCDSVRELEGRIAEHDRPYHDGVFVLDPAIAECLR